MAIETLEEVVFLLFHTELFHIVCTYFTPFSGVPIVFFEQVNVSWENDLKSSSFKNHSPTFSGQSFVKVQSLGPLPPQKKQKAFKNICQTLISFGGGGEGGEWG